MEEQKKEKAIVLKENVGDEVIERMNKLCDAGFIMPSDFNYVNAVKMTMLKLQEITDKNGKSVNEVCTPLSISTALFDMCCKGLNAALSQCYLIIRGDKLCIEDSYFGKILRVKRIFPEWEPFPHVIREGETIEYGIDPDTGRTYLIKHIPDAKNIDGDFTGGYIYLPTKSEKGNLYIMSKKQILTAWAKSSTKEHATHKAFDEKMISKTLINSGCNMIINSTPEFHAGMAEDIEDDNIKNTPGDAPDQEITEFTEVIEPKFEKVNKNTGEIMEF